MSGGGLGGLGGLGQALGGLGNAFDGVFNQQQAHAQQAQLRHEMNALHYGLCNTPMRSDEMIAFPPSPPKTFREELQRETDEWLSKVNL